MWVRKRVFLELKSEVACLKMEFWRREQEIKCHDRRFEHTQRLFDDMHEYLGVEYPPINKKLQKKGVE